MINRLLVLLYNKIIKCVLSIINKQNKKERKRKENKVIILKSFATLFYTFKGYNKQATRANKPNVLGCVLAVK